MRTDTIVSNDHGVWEAGDPVRFEGCTKGRRWRFVALVDPEDGRAPYVHLVPIPGLRSGTLAARYIAPDRLRPLPKGAHR